MKIGLTFDARGGWDGEQATGAPRRGQRLAAGGQTVMLATDDAEEEFDAPATIEALANVIRSLGHDVELLGNGETLMRRLLDGARPDLVFNIAEGRGVSRSREARTPAILEALGIPYTGSDPLSLAVSLDKDCAKRLVAQAGVATPRWTVVEGHAAGVLERVAGFQWPLVVKPAYEGSSKGIRATSLVRDERQLAATLREMLADYRQPILVEEYIEGDELTVGLVGNPPEVLGIMRIIPRSTDQPFIYSLEVKRDWEDVIRYECPAQIGAAATRAVEQAAIAAWRALGCQDFARVDFRLRGESPYFLEANPLPGLNPVGGDIVFLANYVGVSHVELVRRVLNAALERIGA